MIRRLISLFVLCSAIALGEPGRTSVLVLYDSGDAYALPCFEQTIVTLEYNRVPYTTYDLGASPALPDPARFSAVLTTTEMLWKIDAPSCAALRRYVEEGGGMAVLYRGWHPQLSDLFGIDAAAPPPVSDGKSKGLKFTRELMPGISGTVISPSILGDVSAYDVRLLPGASVFAVTDAGLPAGWLRTFGKGRMMFWNAVLLSEKIYRGFIIPTLGAVQPVTASPILNVGIICLDDFPNASPNVKIEPVKSEFDMTVSEFYAFRWFPDMLKLAKQYGVKLTAGLIFSYGEVTTPPYKTSEWVNSTIERGGRTINSSVWITREAQKDIEIGFHGHNHQPLTLKNWHTPGNMKLALSAARKRWLYDNLAPAPVSYIPPMNIIDSTGMSALTEIFPTIRTVGGQYMGRFAMGQNREFGTDPWNPQIKSIPRITSGFIYDDFNRLLTISLLNTVGAWTHFVHPDDILATAGRYAENTREDISAENLLWRGDPQKTGIYYSFERWIAFVKKHYPWLRYTDYRHAHADISRYEASSVIVRTSDRQLTIRINIVPNYITVHVNAGNTIVSCSGGDVVSSSPLAYSTMYVIRATKNDLSIALREPVSPMLYRAGTPQHLYLAGDSRYAVSSAGQTQYPRMLSSIAPVRPARVRRSAPMAVKARTKFIPETSASAEPASAEPAASEPVAEEIPVPPIDTVARMASDTAFAHAVARNFVAMDQKEKAIPVYEMLLKRYPDRAEWWQELYQLFIWSDRGNDASRALAQYVRCMPSDRAALRTLAELYVAQERQTEAIPLYERLVAIQPDSVSTRLMLARLYLWNKRPQDAVREGRRILRRDASNIEALKMAAEGHRANDNWFDARAWYAAVIERNPHDNDARGFLDAARRDHGLLFTSSYERVEDSNNLLREELPVAVELYQSHTADYYLRMQARRVRDDHPHAVASARNAAEGYGAGFGAKFALGNMTSLTLEALAAQYTADWTPVTVSGRFEHAFREGVSIAISAERSETIEGIQAMARRLYTTDIRGELFLQATERWSIGGLAQFEAYSDDNLRSTGALVSSYRIVLRQPEIRLQASTIYQDTKRIYRTSEPYWTPSELFTSSLGLSAAYTLFGIFTPEITETGTMQGGVFSNNLGAKATLQFSPFLQLTAEYGKSGSSVYRQTVARASLSYRY
ncbi:MAG: DUF2194 domain-containing protein [Acidobacteriota bacterium]